MSCIRLRSLSSYLTLETVAEFVVGGGGGLEVIGLLVQLQNVQLEQLVAAELILEAGALGRRPPLLERAAREKQRRRLRGRRRRRREQERQLPMIKLFVEDKAAIYSRDNAKIMRPEIIMYFSESEGRKNISLFAFYCPLFHFPGSEGK